MAIRKENPEGREAPVQQAAPTVNTIDYGMFTTQTLIETYIKRYPVPALIRDMFFSSRDYTAAEEVRIDSKLGGRGLAPFVLPLENQVIGRRRPFKETFITAPIIAPARVITPRELRGPLMGENIYNFKTPEERFASILTEDGQDMDDEIARTEEWMCCQCMFQGKIPINYRNKTNVMIDYGFTNVTALAKPWTDPTALPLDDLTMVQGSLNSDGYSGTVAIYAPDAWTALWKNPNVKDSMKNVFPTFIPVAGLPTGEVPPNGAQRGPSFTSPTMENWIYHATYTKGDPANLGKTTAIPYVPSGCVLVGSSDIANKMVYAVVIQIEQEDGQFHYYAMDRVPKFECNVNKNLYMQTITSRPVPVPVDLLSWAIVTGCV